MASVRLQMEVERVVRALRVLGDKRSLDTAETLWEQVAANTDPEFAVWIRGSKEGVETWAEAVTSVHLAAENESKWIDIGREARAAVAATERADALVDDEFRRDRARRNATPPPAPVSEIGLKHGLRVIRGGAAPRDMAPTVPPPGGRAA